MTQYTLSLAFDSATLNTFAATGTNIVVAKPSADSSAPNVAWVVFSPLENNTIQWDDKYGIYASNAEVQNGASLVQPTFRRLKNTKEKTEKVEQSTKHKYSRKS